MEVRRRTFHLLSLLIVLALLVPGIPAQAARPMAEASVVIDGVKEAAWGPALASDPLGDMSEPNLDLAGLYVVEGATDYYIGFDAKASNWGMAYGIYIDTDQVEGSGATSDPWGRAVGAVSVHRPEHSLYVYHEGGDTLQATQLNHWSGSGWSYDSLVSQGGEQAYGAASDWVEYRVPKAALGNPTSIALEAFTTGGDGHAQDTVPSDPNVAFTAPDWNGGNTTILSAFATFPAPRPKPDNNIWWDGLAHDSRSDLYRAPGGAVTTGTPVTIRLRTFHNDVTGVTLRLWSTAANAQTLIPMQAVATTGEPPYGYDYWQATLPAQERPTVLWYRFIVRDGSDEDYYEDDTLRDGGWGQVFDTSPDWSFQVDVYNPAFQTPDWMKNAVIYQIFPDRFFSGDTKNDPKASDPSVYGNPVLVKSWNALPEGSCRNYQGAGVPCDEQPLGRDFFGGDLAGIRAKLGYLKDLGVTALYLNPIFMAPSNHLYDTTDYTRIDPYLGTTGDFEKLVQEARKAGIRIILDGVFNHTSSDSIYFDKNSRYPRQGAFETQASEFYPWYTFSAWPNTYNSWWGFDTMPVLTEAPAVRSFIYGADDSVARRWIGLGAAGWRLDVANEKSHNWWQEFRPQVKSANPDAVIVGEIWDDASDWLLGNEFDSTMNYRFRRALIGFLVGDYSDPNQNQIAGLNPDQFDSALHSIQEDYPAPAFAALMNLVDSHDTQRILWALTPGARNNTEKENTTNLAVGKARQKVLATLQMTLPGAPTIYYGDEAGLTGDTDPDDRRPFPWGSEDAVLLAHYKALTGLRNAHSFLRTGSFDRLYTHNDDGTYAYGRKDASGAAVIAVNRSDQTRTLSVPLAGYIPEGTVLTDALGGGTYTVQGGRVTVSLAGLGSAVLITPAGVDLTPAAAPTGLTATPGNATVALAWAGVTGAAGYHVYRSPVSGGGYVRLSDAALSSPSYTDGTVANGQTYHYVVTAVDAAGNEGSRSNEVQAMPHLTIGWANVQWPPTLTHTLSAVTPTDWVYGQVWVDGVTNQPGAAAGLLAQLGYGPQGSEPDGNSAWAWVDAAFHVDAGNNDEYKAQLLPTAVGSYDYCYRYSTDGGFTWVYADLNPGTADGYSGANAGKLTVNPAPDTTPPAAPANLHTDEVGPSLVTLAWNAVADVARYEVHRAAASGGPYTPAGSVDAPATTYTDRDVLTGSTYYYVVQAVDASLNKSGYSNEVQATPQVRTVQVTFNVTVPAPTPVTATVHLAGSFPGNDWNPAAQPMTKVDATHWTITAPLTEGYALQYKYALGSWNYVEKDAACGEIANRTATVTYGESGTMALSDTVANWRNVDTCPN